MNKYFKLTLIFFLSSILFYGNINCTNMKNKENISKQENEYNCIEIIADSDLITKNDIVFFFTGISRDENDNQGNFRYIISNENILYYSQNSDVNNEVFNESLKKIKKLSVDQMSKIKSFLDNKDFFRLKQIINTPENLIVEGGNNYYIYYSRDEFNNCVKFEPGNNIEFELESLINTLIRE